MTRVNRESLIEDEIEEELTKDEPELFKKFSSEDKHKKEKDFGKKYLTTL